jgi:mannosyltransferase OCH1-like enzyme
MSIKQLLIPTLNRPPRTERMPVFQQGTSIPRIIHQTFYERSLSTTLQANVDRLRELNPGWEYRFYDDADVEAFKRIDPRYGAARADFFRYLLMYKVGGVYLDIKSTVTRSLDAGLRPDDRYILSKWHLPNGEYEHKGLVYDLRDFEGGEYQQWHIICASGHPFLKVVMDTVLSNIDHYDPYLHQTGKRGVLRLTGPITYTKAIHRIINLHPHRVIDGRKEIGLEYNVYGEHLEHAQVFKGHYSRQTAPIVKLLPFKRQLSRLYGVAQYVHDHLR